MAQAFLITLREGLEMALIVVMVLAYLKRTGHTRLFTRVWVGVALATGISLLAGAILFSLGKGLASLTSDEGQQLLVKTLCAVAHVDGVASGEEIEFIERVIVKLKAQVFVYGREEWGKYEKEVFETLEQVAAS